MAKAKILIGTSGFSYKEWLGGFYPEKLPGARMLEYYAERMPTVEINYTFRAMPKSAMLEGSAAYHALRQAPRCQRNHRHLHRACVGYGRAARARTVPAPARPEARSHSAARFFSDTEKPDSRSLRVPKQKLVRRFRDHRAGGQRCRTVYRGNRKACVAARANRAVRLCSIAQGDLRQRRPRCLGEKSQSPRRRRRRYLRLFQTRNFGARSRDAPARQTRPLLADYVIFASLAHSS